MQYRQEVNRVGAGLWYVDGTSLEPVYVPNANAIADTGIVIVSLRDIEDNAELFMDYQFNLKAGVPDWYSPVNYNLVRESSQGNKHIEVKNVQKRREGRDRKAQADQDETAMGI